MCNVEAIGGGFGIVSQGIGPEQILAAVTLLRLGPDRWEEITDDVVYMGRVVAEVRNNKKPPPEQ